LVDSTGRPLIEPIGAGPFNATGINAAPGKAGNDLGDSDDPINGSTTVGYLQGLPVVSTPAMPTTVGTNSEDLVLVIDTAQALLFEDGDGAPSFLKFEQTLGNQLTTTLVSYGYIAFSAGRVPAAMGKIGGLDATATWGQVAPTY
jgi:hypothetical protein